MKYILSFNYDFPFSKWAKQFFLENISLNGEWEIIYDYENIEKQINSIPMKDLIMDYRKN